MTRSPIFTVLQANTIFETFRAFTPGQLRYLGEHGFIVVASCANHPSAARFFRDQGAEYYPVNMRRNISLVRDVVALISAVRLIHRVRPDILQGSTPKAAFIFLIAGWLLRVPNRLFFMRGVRSSGLSGIKKTVVRLMEKLSCLASHRVLCTSHSVMNEIVREGICAPEKAAVLANGTGNGIDTEYFSPCKDAIASGLRLRENIRIANEQLVVLFVGRLVRDKGIVELALAWDIISTEYPHAVLVIVGMAETEDPVPEATMDYLNNKSSIRIMGSTEDTRQYFAAADIFVLPTYREGIPISLLEASAMSLPVVATRVTGCVDAVDDGVTGQLIPVRDPTALATAISTYLDDEPLRRSHGQHGRNMVIDKFSRERVWAALLNEYETMLKPN